MANWAIVIGVDHYWQDQYCLCGAVRDALAMKQWLSEPAGGNVPSTNLTLLLAPLLGAPKPSARFELATHANIVLSIERMLGRSGGKGERFYFYFSGHGLTQRISYSNQSAILPTDFSDLLPTNSITVTSLFALFQGTRFEQQYFFIDACRNLAFETEKRLGDYPSPRTPIPPVSPQFVMYATQPGVKAMEVRKPNDERGAFTSVLEAGLRGSRGAKRWDDATGDYVVRWNSLFSYVEQAVSSMGLPAGSNDDGVLIQVPRQYGERGALDPDFARIAEVEVPAVTLDINLEPAQIASAAQVVVEMLGTRKESGPPVPALPLRFPLPPRTYAAFATAPGYRMRQRRIAVDLYDSASIIIELDAVPPAPPPSDNQPSSQARASVGADVAVAAPADIGAPPLAAELTVRSADPLLQLEIATASGAPVVTGQGTVTYQGAPGFFRHRAISPEGDVTEQIVELEPGMKLEATAQMPLPETPAMKWAIQASEFDVHNDGTVDASESLPRVTSLKLSTVLALSVGASLEANSGYGRKLRALNIPSFAAGTTSGLITVFGDERLDPHTFRGVEVRYAPLAGRLPIRADHPQYHADQPSIAHLVAPLSRGSYRLWIKVNDNESLSLPFVVLPGRASVFVLTRETDGKLELHQYQPVADSGAVPAGTLPEMWKARDPLFVGSQFAAMRRIERMQRSVEQGRVTPALPDIELLLFDKWADPVAGCLGGYLSLRLGRAAELNTATRNLVTYFGELADSHVLRGEFLASISNEQQALAAFLEALRRGLPIYRDGLVLLNAAIQRWNIRHPLADEVTAALERVPAGALWSVSPEPPSSKYLVPPPTAAPAVQGMASA